MNDSEKIQEIFSMMAELKRDLRELEKELKSYNFQKYCRCGYALRKVDDELICDNEKCVFNK